MPFRSAALVALSLITALALAAPVAAQTAGADPAGGQVSLQQFLAQRDRIFDRIDANHDGQITKEEVAAFQARMETARAGAIIRSGRDRPEGGGGQIERLADLTLNGPLTRAQWDALMTRRFQRLDTAGTGYISRDQLRGGARAAAMAAQPGAPSAAPASAPPQP
jgi:hypothetical protein